MLEVPSHTSPPPLPPPQVSGATSIYVAAQERKTGAICALIAAGGDPDTAREDGATPLFIAA